MTNKQYREKDGRGKYIIRTHHTHTAGGRKIIGDLLQHECKGASDYCMHCSVDMCGGTDHNPYCDTLNDLAYGVDRDAEKNFGKKFRAENIKKFGTPERAYLDAWAMQELENRLKLTAGVPVPDVAQSVNHEEALQLAHLKRGESNLARCYIELRERTSGVEAGDDRCPSCGIRYGYHLASCAALAAERAIVGVALPCADQPKGGA